jgi:FAD:protein FMN transferase
MHSALIHRRCVHRRCELLADLESEFVASSFEAMGCRFEVLLGIERSGLTRIDCVAAGEQVRELVFEWHHRLSVFESGSMVSRINRAPAGKPVVVDDEFFGLCLLSERMRDVTSGAFNIAAGTLMEAHGFRDQRVENLSGLSLDDAVVLDEDRRTVTKADDRIRLDFGGIAKGFMLDLIREELEELGVADAFVHGGSSSVIGMGTAGDTGWVVDAGDGVRVLLDGYALGVSEIGGRVVECDGVSHGHVMDPRVMSSASATISRVACVHRSSAVADAMSTAVGIETGLIGPHVGSDLCTLVVFDGGESPSVYDPLGVVQS